MTAAIRPQILIDFQGSQSLPSQLKALNAAVTRNGPAWRRGVDGYYHQSPRVNLITYSEGTVNWGLINTTYALDATAPPAGIYVSTALKCTRTSTTANAYVGQGNLAIATGQTATVSFYAKADTVGSGIGMRVQATYPNRVDAVFNLSTGALAYATGFGNLAGGAFSTTMSSAGAGWYYCTVSVTAGATAINSIYFSPTSATSSSGDFTGADGALSNVYVAALQVELAAVAGPYFPAGSQGGWAYWPEFDYNGVANGGWAAVIEPAQTNLVLQSSNVQPAVWGLSQAVKATSGGGVSIFSGNVCTGVTASTSTPQVYQLVGTFTGAAETAYAIVEVPAGVTQFRLFAWDNTASATIAGIVTTTATGVATSGGTTPPTIYGTKKLFTGTSGPNGGTVWLVWMTYTGTSGNNREIGISAWDNGQTIYPHHVQLVGSSILTSPIITTSAQVNRGAESIACPVLPGWFSQSILSCVVDYSRWFNPTSINGVEYFFSLSDGTVNNRIEVRVSNSNTVASIMVAGGVTQPGLSANVAGPAARIKVGNTFLVGTCLRSFNGVTGSTYTATATPTGMKLLVVGANSANGNQGTHRINCILIQSAALSQSALNGLTV